MPERGGRYGWWWLGGAVVVAVVLLAVAVTLAGTGRREVARTVSPRPTPSGPPARAPLLAALPAGAPAPGAAALGRALAVALRDRHLGSRVALSVVDAASGRPLLERRAGQPVVPASTAKIATAVAALSVLPPDGRLHTRVVVGSRSGEVVLVGGGDPTLEGTHPVGGYPRPARLADLARAVRLGTGGVPVRRVVVDDSLYVGPRMGPGWKPGYVTGGDVAPVSALEADGGRAATGDHAPRLADPALSAGRQLAALLGGPVSVVRGRAPAGAAELAVVSSPTVAGLVERMLSRSDNDLAEALGRQVALARQQPASFTGEAAAVAEVLSGLRAPAGRTRVELRDASGLSPLDRVSPAAVTWLLHVVAGDRRYAPVLSGLPVAGFGGTLATRFRRGTATAGAGLVRAKTGTLAGVSALAGLVRTRDGRLLAFDVTADGVSSSGTLDAQAALDQLAARIAGCGCPAGP